jgi:hypothetical protein
MRALLVVLSLVAFVGRAEAWSPGPYTFERCVDEFPVAALGVVSKVDTVDTRPGGWTLSRATLDVQRLYHGISPAPKQLAFYFWSTTDNAFTIAHAIAAKDRILVFLSTDLTPVQGMKTDPAVTHMLQFAKANHRGYLFTVNAATNTIHDAVFAKDPKASLPLGSAELALKKKKKP